MTEEIRQLQASLEQNPRDREAFQALDEIYRTQQDWFALLSLHVQHAQQSSEDEQRSSFEELARSMRRTVSEVDARRSKGELLVQLGDLYFSHLGMREEAMTAYQESFRVYPKDTTCLERARSIYSEQGDYERVVVLYELQTKVLRKSGEQAKLAATYVEMAEIFGDYLGDAPRALELAASAQELDPGVQGGAELRARYAGSSEAINTRIVEFIQKSGELAGSDGVKSAALMVRAARLEREREGGSLERAAALLERAVERDPDNEAALLMWEEVTHELEAASDETAMLTPEQLPEQGAVEEPSIEEPTEVSDAYQDAAVEDVSREQAEPQAVEIAEVSQEGYESADPSEDYVLEEIEPGEVSEQADEPEEEQTHEAEAEEIEALAQQSREQESPEPVAKEPVESAQREPRAGLVDPESLEPVSEGAFDEAMARHKKEPKDLGNLAVIERELTRRRDWDALVEVQEHSVKHLRRQDAEFEVMRDLAMVLWQRLSALDRAEYYFKRLRHHDGEMVEVLDFYEEFLEQKEQWRKLHLHLVQRLPLLAPEAQRDYTRRIAQVSEQHMSNPEKAIEAWRNFLGDHTGDAEARDELRRLYEEHEKWNALVEYLRDELARLEQQDASVPERVAVLEEIAGIYRDKVSGGDLNRINALNQLLELDAGHREGFDELKVLLEGNRRFSDLASLLSSQADAAAEAGDIGRAVGLLTEVADLWQERLNNITQALPFLQKILELDPHHASTRERLKGIYTQRRDFPSLFELMEAERQTKSGAQLEAHLREMLELAQEKLRDTERAEQLLAHLLEANPEDAELLERLEGIYRRKDAPADLAALLERKAALEGMSDEDIIAATREAAALYDSKLGDAERAATLWRRVLTLDAANATAFARLRDIYIEQHAFDELFELFEGRAQLERYYDTLDAMAKEAGDDAAKRGIYRRMAQLAEAHLQDEVRVIASLEHVLTYTDEDRPAVARELIGWYRQTGALASEIEMHKLLLEEAEDAVDRFAELVRLAELEIEREEDAAALKWQLDAVAVMPGDAQAIEKAEHLARHVDMLPALLDHLELIAGDVEQGSALWRELLKLVAQRSRDDLEDNARAIDIFESLHKSQPESLEWLEALEDLYERAAYPDKRITTLRQIIALLEADGAAQDRIVVQLARIADVQHRHLGQQDEARRTYNELLEVNADFVPALQGLREIHAVEGSWDEVLSLLEREFELVDVGDEERRMALHMELAQVWLTYKERPAEALHHYREVLTARPHDEAALERAEGLLDVDDVARDAALLVEPLLRSSEQDARLAAALEARLRVTQDSFEEQEIFEELVPLYRERLQLPQRAFEHAARRFELDASNEARWDEMSELAAALEKWPEVERLFVAWSPLLPEQEEAHAARTELLRRVATIRAEHLHDVEGALQAWERLYDFEPSDLSVIEALEALYRQLDRDESLVAILDARAEVVTEPDARVYLLLEAAMLSDGALGDVSRAIVFYQRVLELDQGNPSAVKELEGLLRAEERYFDLDEFFTEQANLSSDPTARRNFLLQQAAMRTQNLQDHAGAFQILRQLILDDDSDPRAIMLMVTLDQVVAQRDEKAPLRLDIALELERLYREKGDYPKLIQVLEVRLGFTDEPFERLALLDELSEQHRTHVVDHARAFERTREAVVLMPDDQERRELLETLGEKTGQLEEVVIAYAEAALEADPFVAAPLYKRSGQLLAGRLERAEEAIDAYERVLEINEQDAETLAALEHLYTYTSQWEQLADNLRTQSQYAQPEVRQGLLRRIGELEESELERADEAIDAWVSLLESEPEAMDAMDALERLYRQEGRTTELGDILRQKANFTPDDATKLEVLHDLARVHEMRAEEIPDAIQVYREMRVLDPHHTEALIALDRLFKEEGAFSDLSEVLHARLSIATGPNQQTELALRRARILGEELLNIDDALALYLEVFEREPGQPVARAALERYVQDVSFAELIAEVLIGYYKQEALSQELVGLYEVLRDQSHDPVQQADYSWQIALIQRDLLGDADAAMQAMGEAWRLRPEQDEWRANLRAVTEALGSWEELARIYEDVLLEVSDPERLKVLRVELAEIYRDELENVIEAEQQYREALNLDERELSIYAALEAMLAHDERWQALIELLDRRYMVFAGEPGSQTLLLRIASIWDEFVQDKFSAIDAYRRVLVEQPRDEMATSAINRLYREQENFPELSMFLEDQLALASQDTELRLALRTELAQVYADQLHEPERALELWRQILAEEPYHEGTIASLERLFREDAAMQEPVGQTLEPIYRQREQWEELVRLLSSKVEAEGDPFTQVELLRDVAHISETHLRAWPLAIESYGRIFAVVPEDEAIRGALKRLGERLNAWPKVCAIYEDTLRDNFNIHDTLRAQMLIELGLIREERLGQLEQARETYARVRDFEPTHPEAFDALERVNLRLGDWTALSQVYQSYADAEFDAHKQMELFERLATLHEEVTGDLNAAIDVSERMLQIHPTDRATYATLERLYKESSRFEDLADLYRRLMLDVSDDPQRALGMRYRLAQLVEAELDQIDDALGLYQEILADHPGHRDTLRALEGMRRDLKSREGDWSMQLVQIAHTLLENYDESQDWRRIVELLDLKQSSSEDVHERVVVLGEAADVVDRHAEERADSFTSLRYRTLAWTLSPERTDIFGALERVADRLEAWERVLPQILEHLEDTETPEEKASLLNATARVYQEKLRDRESALVAYEQTLELSPADEVALEKLEGLYGEFEHWRPLVNLLRVRLENTFDGDRRINLLLRIANLHEDILEEPEEAIRAYEELRELDSSSRTYLDALCALYDRTDRDHELVDALQARVDMMEDPDEQLGTLKKLAQIQHEIVQDHIGAVDTYRRILSLDDTDERAVRALIELYAEQGAWHELLEMLNTQRDFAADVQELDRVEFRMSEILLDQLDQPFEALENLRRITTRSPDWEPALETMTGLLEHDMVREEAFLTLEDLHRSAARWQELATLYEARLEYLDDPHQLTGTYLKLANLQEGQLNSPTSAMMTHGRAFKKMPGQESVRVQLERLAEELETQEMLIGFYEDALAQGVSDAQVSKILHMRLGELYIDEREEADPAIEHLEAVLELDEYHIKALELLDKLYQFKERYDDLADVLQRQIAVAPPEAVSQARYRLGYLRERIFEQPLDAFDLYRQVILDQPDHRKVIEALERLIENESLQAEVCDLLEGAYTTTQNWSKLIQLLKIKLERVADAPHERAELMRRIASLELEREENAEAAFEYYGLAFAEDPFELDTQQRLESLAAQYAAWPAMVDLYESIVADLDDPVRQGELAMRAAEWSRVQLEGDLERAHRLYMIALEVEPQSLEILSALEQIARQRGEEQELVDILGRKVDVLFEPEARFETFQELGALHASAGRHNDAIIALREAAMIEASNTEVMRSLVGLYEETEDWFEMVEQLELLVNATQDEQERLALLARQAHELDARLDDASRAIDAYERALEMSPDSLELLRAVEPLYSKTGQLDRMSANLERQLELAQNDEDRVRVMCSRAKIAHVHHHDTEAALALYKEAYLLSPASPIITAALDELYRSQQNWVELFNLYYAQLEQTSEAQRRAELSVEMARVSWEKLGDTGTALQYLDFALGTVPNFGPALGVKEQLYISMEDWPEVIGVLGKQFEAAEEDEQKIALLLRRADLQRNTLQQPQDAIDDYVEVLNLDILHEEAYRELVIVLNQLQAWEQLYQVMNFRVEATPEAEQKQMFLDMAEVARKMDDSGARTDALEAAYQLDPSDLDVVEPLLDATIAANQFDRAEPLLEEVINTLTEKRRMKDVVRFYHLRGKLAEQQGDNERAMQDYEAARKIDATYVPNLLSLGKMHYQAQDWDAALKIFQTLLLHQMNIKDNEAKVDMYYHLGQVRLQLGDARRAKDMFNRALGVDANHEPSRQALEGM